MSTVQKEAATLTESERVQLIDFLWDSLTPDEMRQRESKWAEEAERQAQAVKSGELKTRDAHEVIEELRKRAGA